MTDAITAGSILTDEAVRLPDSLRLYGEPDSNGWATLHGGRSAFEKEIGAAGWTFFFMAGEIQSTVFGFDRQKSLRAALKGLIANVKSHHCNSIEIAQVASRSFLKIPYVSVSAHPRHLQRGLVFAAK